MLSYRWLLGLLKPKQSSLLLQSFLNAQNSIMTPLRVQTTPNWLTIPILQQAGMLQQPQAHPRLKRHVEPHLFTRASLLKQITLTRSMNSTVFQCGAQNLSKFLPKVSRTAVQQLQQLHSSVAISNALRMLKPSKDRKRGDRRRQHFCLTEPPQDQWLGLLRVPAGARRLSSILSGCKAGSQCSCLFGQTGLYIQPRCIPGCLNCAARNSMSASKHVISM